jgi:hypothetical protein
LEVEKMNEKKFRYSEDVTADTQCPTCKSHLPDHNVTQLIHCAVAELSKNKTKKMMYEQQDLTPSQTSAPSKGGSNFE